MRLTADHAEIRRWVEEHGGCPALEPVGDGRDRLAIVFDESECEQLAWEEFFERLDREALALEYVPHANGQSAREAKLVSR